MYHDAMRFLEKANIVLLFINSIELPINQKIRNPMRCFTMLLNYFIAELMDLLRQKPPRLSIYSVVHVVVNNAAPQRRPSSAILEVEGRPSFSLLISPLPAPFSSRALIINQHLWPVGDCSPLKRQLSDRVDAFLAEVLHLRPTHSLHRPLIYTGSAQSLSSTLR